MCVWGGRAGGQAVRRQGRRLRLARSTPAWPPLPLALLPPTAPAPHLAVVARHRGQRKRGVPARRAAAPQLHALEDLGCVEVLADERERVADVRGGRVGVPRELQREDAGAGEQAALHDLAVAEGGRGCCRVRRRQRARCRRRARLQRGAAAPKTARAPAARRSRPPRRRTFSGPARPRRAAAARGSARGRAGAAPPRCTCACAPCARPRGA